MFKRIPGWIIVFGCLLTGCAATRGFEYPPARKADVVDDYHGTKVADPYRWLEDAQSAETVAWVKAQNDLTRRYVRSPLREKINKRLTEIWNYPRYSIPRKEGGRYFFEKNDGLQNQSVYYVQDSLDAEPRAILDPNKFSEDGTSAIAGVRISKDGKLMAYLLSHRGSDWQELKIRKIDTGEDYPEVLRHCRFAGIAWKPDGSGFFYNRFPDPETVSEEDRNAYNRVYWHTLGTPQRRDRLVYERKDDRELRLHPIITEDGKHLLLYVSRGSDPKKRIYYREVESDGDFVRLLDKADAMYQPIGTVGSTFYFHTDLDAPKGRIIAIDINKPDRKNWKEIIGQREDTIARVKLVSNHLAVATMKDARHVLNIYDLEGKFVRGIELPGIGSVYGLVGKQDDTEMFFGYVSFLQPESIFRYDFKADKVELFRGPEIKIDLSEYETKQIFYQSKDGTRVPMFIVYRQGIRLDGTNPTLLYGYGGFKISRTPFFSIPRIVWLENGGVFALANIRGGGEYGEEWHQAGTLGNKQNVFDDFIKAGEWLIENKYTSTKRLAILGGSNGGLLTAACMLQRPDLFGAVISSVPVTDMLRYHRFSVGRYWVSDYGNAEKDPEHFKFLYAYSPVHNVKAAVYPPTLIATADTDDRVVPLHGKKFTAVLQAKNQGENPILLRVETKAGHGRGKPTAKRIETNADIYTFLFKTFKMTVAGK
jgi:prolyl oligopeptidase